MQRLKIDFYGYELHQAGLPKFSKIFARDSFLSAILMQNPDMLKQQISFSATRQGKKRDPHSGEEPGKIFHEYPQASIRNLSTEYNACDTTALFLIAHEVYQRLTGNKNLVQKYKQNIFQAVNYIKSHLYDYLFIEDPKFCGAKKFALKVTYWKDAELCNRKNKEPNYPVIYPLAHLQNMQALRSAAFLLKEKKLDRLASKMLAYAKKYLFDKKTGAFYLALDQQGPISGISSDSLHALFYLRPQDLSQEQLKKTIESTSILETLAGYRTINIPGSKYGNHDYSIQVWPFEQAFICIGARKFNLNKVAKISSRVIKWLDTEPELIIIKDNKVKKKGCDPQLWTIAAKEYFQKIRNRKKFKLSQYSLIKMHPYPQSTPFTTAASSLLTILHHFNKKIKLSKENEFCIWQKTVLLPTRASSIYALAILAKQHNLNPKIIVEKKEYDFPDYRFHRYKKTDIEHAQFSSQLYLKKAEQLNIPIQEKSFTLNDVKKELQKNNIILLRVNAGPIRKEKSTSQYIIVYNFDPKKNHFQIIDPALGNLSLPQLALQEAFQTLETKKYRHHRMIVLRGHKTRI